MLSRFTLFLLTNFLLCTAANAHFISSSLLTKGLIIGHDDNAQALILCRTQLFGGLEIGKVSADKPFCLVNYNGKVYSVKEFTIPERSEFGTYTWASSKQDPISVGRMADGRPLYLCQSNLNGHLLLGKTWPGYNRCNVEYKNEELIAPLSFILSYLR